MTGIDNIIDEAYSEEFDIEPSPFFAKRVIAAVRMEATIPPIEFPLRRIAAGVLLLITCIVTGMGDADATSLPFLQQAPLLTAGAAIIGCALLAAASVEIHRRIRH